MQKTKKNKLRKNIEISFMGRSNYILYQFNYKISCAQAHWF